VKAILFVFVLFFSINANSAPVLISYFIDGDVSHYTGTGIQGCQPTMCKFFVTPNTDQSTPVSITATIDFQYSDYFLVREQIVGVNAIDVSFVNPKETIFLDSYAQALYKGYHPGIYTLVFSGVLLDLESWGGFGIYTNGQTPHVPIPAAFYLFAPALLGFMGLRRRAKSL
jgi:hypothetical protein